MNKSIAEAIDVVVQVERHGASRRVSEILRVQEYSRELRKILTETIYKV